MVVRSIEPKDTSKLIKIHEQFYKEEFPLPDFTKNYLATFVVTTDNDEIITVGGVKNILESIVMTDKSFSPRIRKDALFYILEGSIYFVDRSGHNELHCYVQGDNWVKILNKVGFRPTKGQSLVASW